MVPENRTSGLCFAYYRVPQSNTGRFIKLIFHNDKKKNGPGLKRYEKNRYNLIFFLYKSYLSTGIREIHIKISIYILASFTRFECCIVFGIWIDRKKRKKYENQYALLTRVVIGF